MRRIIDRRSVCGASLSLPHAAAKVHLLNPQLALRSAWVRLRDRETATAEEIRVFCQGQIADYKVPRYIKFVDSFPMTVTGKIQKFLMRQHMIEELGPCVEKIE